LPVLLDELASLEAASGRLAARRVRVLAAIHGVEVSQWVAEAGAGGGPVGYESVAGRDRHWVSEEVGLILRVAGVTARDRLLHADQLVTRLPETVAALAVGVLHPLQAQRLSEAVIALTDEQCAQVQERALAKAAANPSQSVTGFTRTLQRIVMSTVPKTAEQAHTDALAEARVEVCPLDHGMALLLAWLPAPDALRVAAAIHARAHLTGPTTGPTGSTGPGACQVIDARRAQALVELIDLGACADPTSTWRRLVTDPLGKLIDYGRDRDEPPPELANHIRARDQVCTFPNCHRRAISCELDHVQPWAQRGHTNTDNLIAACARHHHLKHDGGWTNHYNPTTGTTTWTSPTTRTYHNPPPDLPTNPAPTNPSPTNPAPNRLRWMREPTVDRAVGGYVSRACNCVRP